MALQRCEDRKGEVEGNWEDEELNYEVDVNPKRNGSLLAEVRLRFQDGAIVVSAELKECIMQHYEEKLEQQNREEPNKRTPVR